MTQAPTLSPGAATPAAVLEAVSAARAARDAEDARILMLAVEWADLHPAEAINTTPGSAGGWFGDRPVRLAGAGTPEVSEFCLAELAAALGVPTEVGRALRLSVENVPRVKLQQFARWAHEGVFCSADGAVDYRAGLGRVGVPVLVIGGSADRLATPAAVARALEHLPAQRATYLEFGRAHGHGADYGHVDIVLGRSAPAEVFPAVAGWLTAHTR